jgi:hypothetical protein
METTNQPGGRRPKKRNANKTDIRLLIAAASITATIGGVGLIAQQDATATLSAAVPTPGTQAATSGALTQQAPQAAAPSSVPDPTATTGSGAGAEAPTVAPTATQEPAQLPVVTMPLQRPNPFVRSRSSR